MSNDISPDDAMDVVRHGYDRISERYTAWVDRELSPGRSHALEQIFELVPPGARVLDLGCGAGLPMSALLAERYAVRGVDISAVQIEHARQNVPKASFQQAEMSQLELPAASYDAVVAFYSLTHVPRERFAEIMAKIRHWLRPDGVFVASLGVSDEPGMVEEDWLGAPMYFSHFDAAASRALVELAGFTIRSATIVVDPEDSGPAPFLWVVALPASGRPAAG